MPGADLKVGHRTMGLGSNMAEQKIKFPVFDYQGLPLLFALLILGGLHTVFSNYKDIESIMIGILLFSLGAFPMCIFLFHRKYIIRIDSSDHIIFGQEFTENFDIKNRKIPISDLFYTTYKSSGTDSEGGSYTNYWMKIKENNQTIIKTHDYDIEDFDSAPNFMKRFVPNWKESLKSTLPELFEIEHIISYNQKLRSIDRGFNPIKTDEKYVENIFQAEIVDGRLHGYTTDLDDAGRLEAYVEYCLGLGIKDHKAREYARANPESTIGKTDHKKSPTIYGMVFDEDGTTRVETKKKVYRVEYKSWKNLPSNYPSNTEGDWWEEK